MKTEILNNKFKLIYKHNESNLTSICVSINGGAGEEKGKLGVAHAVEHMVYKGTKNRSEAQINTELSDIFGFQNAMTNYPYVIYYGTLLSEDLEKGIELFSDIILNPSFSSSGFKEEMDVIKEELHEWDEELEQYTEDKLFLNTFDNRRIKYPIIGTEESLKSITLEDLKMFYEENYSPDNASIVVVSSLDFDTVREIVNKYFDGWKKKDTTKKMELKYETPKNKIFYEEKLGIKSSRVQIISPIDMLSQRERKAFMIFNKLFGEGVNSVLYDNLRTKKGLIYDVITNIAYENYIKLYKITYNTSKENIEKSIDVFKECVSKIEEIKQRTSKADIAKLIKSLKLTRLFKEEKSIVLAKELSTYDTMFGDFNIYNDEINGLEDISKEEIFEAGKKVLDNISIQVIY